MANSAVTVTRVAALEALRINLIVERARLRISQSALAERSGVSRPTISRLERAAGDVGVTVVQRLAIALNTSVSELLAFDDSPYVDDAEIARRAADPPEMFIGADAFLEALDEAHSRLIPSERYSRAGRRAVARRAPPTSI
jgi:transcriptional regulator with XRE-family HTH domain